MKRLILVIGLWAGILNAQQVEVFGYFEPQYMGVSLDDNFYQVSSNKLRIDFASDLSDNVSFGANFNYITYHGKTEWNITSYLPENITAQIPAALREAFVFQFGDMVQAMGPMTLHRPDRIFLDNAYVKLAFKYADITVGRQQLSFGSGYVWNPTDLFNIKDVTDPTYEQPGHNAVRVESQFLGLNVDAVYAPGDEWEDSAKMLQIKSTLGHFDVSLAAAEKMWSFTDYSYFLENKFKRQMFGGNINGELFGIGAWAEAGFNKMESVGETSLNQIKDFTEIVAGMDYTFENSLYVMAEYYQNSLAQSDWKKYTLNDWMWMFSGELKTMTRDQVYAMAQYPATDLMIVGCSGLASISDGSFAVIPSLTYNLFEDVELTAFINLYVGKDGRAYASNMGNGGMARLRYYF